MTRTQCPVDIGGKYGRLTILRLVSSKNNRKVEARCDCGVVKTFQWTHIRLGKTKSCNCLQVDASTKHGQASVKTKKRTPLYQSWIYIKQLITSGKKKGNPSSNHEMDRQWITFEGFALDFSDTAWKLDNDEGIRRVNKKLPWTKENCCIRKINRKEKETS
jgi:hypothetical protein